MPIAPVVGAALIGGGAALPVGLWPASASKTAKALKMLLTLRQPRRNDAAALALRGTKTEQRRGCSRSERSNSSADRTGRRN